MWYLSEVKDTPSGALKPSPKYWLGGVSAKERTIGRKHVDIRLKASSVSRTHAKITVFKAGFYSPTAVAGRRRHQSTSVSVQDSSAYGTFLKYPPGHTSNRMELAAGHHRRLDKDTPMEISEGALLAFGAPSAWWRLGWQNIVVMSSRLSHEEHARLAAVVQATSLECVDTWAHDVTHLIMSHCVCSSLKFLTALVENKHIVTMAWVEAVNHTVAVACRAITDAANPEGAFAACELADEKRFIPPFSSSDQAIYSSEVLASVFDSQVKERRSTLFQDTTFAFTREDRRARWASIIGAMGGNTILAQAITTVSPKGKIIFIQSDQNLPKRPQEVAPTVGRAYVQESALIAAILGADVSALSASTDSVKQAVAEVTDVATPGPLDESDNDSVDSDPGVPVPKQETRQAVGADSNGETPRIDTEQEQPRALEPSGTTKKRARVPSDNIDEEEQVRKPSNITRCRGSSIVAESPPAPPTGEEMIDSEEVNERTFFKLNEIVPTVKKLKLESISSKGSTGRNVRPFRQRKLPSAAVIPLKKVRYDTEGRSTDVKVAKRETLHREYSSGYGAQVVVESDEE